MLPNQLKKLMGKLYAIALIVFAVWYGYFIYPIIFSHAEHHGLDVVTAKAGASVEEKMLQKVMSEQKSTATTDLGYTVVKEKYVKGHFHHVGMTMEKDETSVCARCHGSVPHSKAKPIRAFLNMHAFFIGCETCHIKAKPDQAPWSFRWYDKITGKILTSNPKGLVETEKEMHGNYGAKIGPGTLASDGSFNFLNGERERAFVIDYLKNKDALNSTDQSKMKKVIHRLVDEKPLLCDNCHTSSQKPYIPFDELGYPQRRIQQITSTEVVGMLQKYRDFYFPRFVMPGQTRADQPAPNAEQQADASKAR